MPGFLVDTSVWVASVFPTHSAHHLAQHALEQASADHPAVFCRATEQSFLRTVTTATVFKTYAMPNMTNVMALEMLAMLLSLPHVIERAEPAGMIGRWRKMAALPSASPKIWMDAYLAAFALTDQITLLTLDKDFRTFSRFGLDCTVLTVPPAPPKSHSETTS